ncbi:DNA polymerase epsilon subunit 2 [Cimex lectularius]|uniref:DNA polymerase epsilon subunit n=1 Tax=Cimex lectularius TaxID=79782 RepID=A0A8I6RLY0_CIMLE|nr:DNA polymerase epsilon subunit 2 [Cimex lectularius]
MSADKELRKKIVALFQLNGFTVRGDAADFLTETLSPLSKAEREEWIEKITDHCQKRPLTSSVLEKSQLEKAILDSCKSEADEDEELLSVVSAFDVPKFDYSLERKKFLPSFNGKRELFGLPASKGLLLKDRYTIVYQRTMRNELFHGAANDVSQYKLRPVECLLATTSKLENVVVLGVLTQLKEGRYYIEDPSGFVQVDLSNTTYHDGLFTDSCFVLAEGFYQDDILTVQAMGLPPRENAEVSRVYFGTANYFGGSAFISQRNNERLKALERQRDDSMFVFLSDVWLDQPQVLDKLRTLFIGYNTSPPTVFVLFGNFLSCQKGHNRMTSLKDGFRALGEIISQNVNLVKMSKFIIVPGPTDTFVANILPRPALPEFILENLKAQVPGLISMTNPCRIQYCTQEIVLIREDIVTKLCRNTIHFPVIDDIGLQFAKTIICQAHLVPLSLNVCPVYWEYDAALQLYPTPDVVVVADQHKAFSSIYNNCHVVNPGPFSKGDFSFKVYYPASKEVEDCQIPSES